MTQVSGTRRRLAAVPEPAEHSVPAAVLLAAGWYFLLGITLVGTVVLIGWATSTHLGTSTSQALRAAAQVWLACQHVPVQLPIGAVSLLPLGLVALPGVLGYRIGRWAAGATGVNELGPGALLAVGIAVAYGALAALLAGVTRTQVGAAAPAQGFAGAFFVAIIAVGFGVLRAAGLWPQLIQRIPGAVRPLLHESAVILVFLFGSAAAVISIVLATHAAQVIAATRALGAQGAGGLLLVLLGLAYLPDALLWLVAYFAGPGFMVGSGTLVSPLGHVVGALPNFPLLAAIPAHQSAWAPLLLAFPIAGGVLVAWRRRSAGISDLAKLLADSLAVAAVVGIAVAALTSESAGSLGAGRLAQMGPDGVAVGAATAGLVLIGLGLGALASFVERHFAR